MRTRDSVRRRKRGDAVRRTRAVESGAVRERGETLRGFVGVVRPDDGRMGRDV